MLVDQETLTAQLAEKNSELQKWREERDELVTAVETQMKALLVSCKHKDEEIQELRKAAAESSGTVSGRLLLCAFLLNIRCPQNYFSAVYTQHIRKEPSALAFWIFFVVFDFSEFIIIID